MGMYNCDRNKDEIVHGYDVRGKKDRQIDYLIKRERDREKREREKERE